MKERILDSVRSGVQAVQQLLNEQSLEFIEKCSALIADCFSKERKVIIAGNGGSLCDAAHFLTGTGPHYMYSQRDGF
jgi:D-sedoheptulose 7-phosphate isomerase